MMRSSGQEYASVDFNKIGVGGWVFFVCLFVCFSVCFFFFFSFFFLFFFFFFFFFFLFVRRPDVIFKKEKKKEGINLMNYLFL